MVKQDVALPSRCANIRRAFGGASGTVGGLPDNHSDWLERFVGMVKQDVALPSRCENIRRAFEGGRIPRRELRRPEVGPCNPAGLPQPSKIGHRAGAVDAALRNV